MKRVGFVVLMSLAAGCSGEEPARLVGGDVDQHGCKASAGYRWCQSTQGCERPWELATAQGFDNTAEAFDAFCKGGS